MPSAAISCFAANYKSTKRGSRWMSSMHRHAGNAENALVVGQHALGLLPPIPCPVAGRLELEHFVMARLRFLGPRPEFYPILSANVPVLHVVVAFSLLSFPSFFCTASCLLSISSVFPQSSVCFLCEFLRFCARSLLLHPFPSPQRVPNSSSVRIAPAVDQI